MYSKYYQDELAYLRELGQEYAAKYPAIAPMLAGRGADPDVERLLEGVAFLTARIRQKLDDELPELITSVATLLFPQLTRPVPGTGILELTPLPNVLREVRRVPRGTEFESVPVEGTSCRFSSTTDCEVVPLTITDARFLQVSATEQHLRVELSMGAGGALDQGLPERLRLHLSGEDRLTLTLLLWLLEHTRDVRLVASKLGSSDEKFVSLGKKALVPFGYAEDEALLPLGNSVFPGFRLLLEYNTLPAKFAFVEITGMRRTLELETTEGRFALVFVFERAFPLTPQLPPDTLKLNCVPIVNVFKTTAEPIRLQSERERFLVRPAGLPAEHGEVFDITRVEAISRGSALRQELSPFLDFSHAHQMGGRGRPFYSVHLDPSTLYEGADTLISIGTPENQQTVYDADILSIELLATNRKLANSVRAGDVTKATSSSPPFATFRNLRPITTHIPSPVGTDLQWRAVAHATTSLRSLTEAEVLRAVLAVYNLQASVDQQAARANDLRIESVKGIVAAPAERLYRGSPLRGVSIEVELEESGFASDGDLYLFGSILERFFSDYVSLNSFSTTSVTGVQSRVHYTWPPRSGSITLI